MPLIPDTGSSRSVMASAADGEVDAGCLPLGFVSLGLAFGDLPGDASGDIRAGWGRAEQIDVVG